MKFLFISFVSTITANKVYQTDFVYKTGIKELLRSTIKKFTILDTVKMQ